MGNIEAIARARCEECRWTGTEHFDSDFGGDFKEAKLVAEFEYRLHVKTEHADG